MNSLYLTIRQSRLLRVLALAIFGIVASSAAAETIDLGELEMGKAYDIPSDLNTYYGHVTAPKTGVLTYVNKYVSFSPYSNTTWSEDALLASDYTGRDGDGAQCYTLKVTKGDVYYFYFENFYNQGAFSVSMTNDLKLTRSTVDEGATLSAGGRGAIEYVFNQSITVDKVTLTAGKKSVELSADDETYRISGATLIVEYGDILTSWYNLGLVAAGDEVKVNVSGLCAANDATIKYNNDGEFEAKYVAAAKPVTLVSATTGDGSYKLTNTQYAPCKFLSYFKADNPDGKYIFTFSDAIDTTKGAFQIQFGSKEADDWYTEDVTPVFSNDNKTITIDATGVVRDYKKMSSSSTNYGEIYLAMSYLYAADGQLVYTGVSGSEGSFTFPFYYSFVSSNVSSEFTPNDKFDDTIEIYISGYDQVSYDGVKFSWTEKGKENSVVVAKSDLSIETDDFNGGTIVVTVPAEVKSRSNVTVTLNNATFNDGQDHSSAISNVFNYVAASVASDINFSYTPNTLASVASCEEMVITFPDYTNVSYNEGTAMMSDRTGTSTVKLDAAKAGENGSQMVQPISGATKSGYYTVTFPEGYFLLDDNVVSPEFSATFAVEATTSTGSASVTTDPANGAVVESCDKIVLTFNNYNAAACSWFNKATISKDGGEAQNLGDAEWGDEDNQMVQPLGGLAAENGVYTVTFPAEYFVLGEEGEDFSEEIVITFTVGQEEEAAFNVVSDPVSGSTVESCDKITLTFPDYMYVGFGAGKATISKRGDMDFGTKELGDAGYGTDDNQAVQSLGGVASEQGMYIVTFPEGYFDLILDDDSEPVASPEFYVSFVIEAAKAAVNITSTPANNSTVASCDAIDIIFNDYEEVGPSWWGKATISKDGGEAIELGDVDFGEAWNEIIQPLNGNAAQDGKYVVTFPDGYLVGDEAHDYDNIPGFTITFTVDKTAGVTDLTVEGDSVEYYNLNGVKVASPAKGIYIVKRGTNVTKEAVK
jgi:hypothetical protein